MNQVKPKMTPEEYARRHTELLHSLMAMEGMVFCQSCKTPTYAKLCTTCKKASDKPEEEVA